MTTHTTPHTTPDVPESNPRLRIVIATGGTAGHLAPALVIAHELRERGHYVAFIVSDNGVDARTVVDAGYPCDEIAVTWLNRKIGLSQIRTVAKAVKSIFTSSRLLRRIRPHVVLAGGGFTSVPVAVAAARRRIPVVLTEADAHLGLANRITARFARRMCTAYPLPVWRHKQVVTGRPVAAEFFSITRDEARTRMSLPTDSDAMVVAVFGGSGGARHINEVFRDAYAMSAGVQIDGRDVWIIHVVGRRDFSQYEDIAANPRYRVVEYCDDMPALLAAADLVVCRSGGSVFELAAVGRASILVPYPFAAGDHQEKNAQHLVQREAAVMIVDNDLTVERITTVVADLLSRDGDEVRCRMSKHSRAFAHEDAATDIATIIEQSGKLRE